MQVAQQHPRSRFTRSLSVYLVCLTAGVLAQGCRFGNRVVNANTEDGVTGYYATVVQDLRYCVSLKQGDGSLATQCADGSLNALPTDVGSVMTNPVLLFFDDPKTGEATIRHKDDYNTFGFTTRILAGNVISSEQSYPPEGFWLTGCDRAILFALEGSYSRFDAGVAQDGKTLAGTLSLDAAKTTTFDAGTSDCTAAMDNLEACYSDPSQCGGQSSAENDDLSAAVQDYFAPYILAGTLTVPQISDVRVLYWEAAYR